MGFGNLLAIPWVTLVVTPWRWPGGVGAVVVAGGVGRSPAGPAVAGQLALGGGVLPV